MKSVSVHPIRLFAVLLLAVCVAIGAYQMVKPHTVTYIQLREGVEKESGQRLEVSDVEPLVLTMGNVFQRPSDPIPGLLLWEDAADYIGLSFTRQATGGRPLLKADLEKAGGLHPDHGQDSNLTGMTIPVDNVAGVSPYVSQGERVHVYASFEDDAGAHTGLLLQNMQIVGIQREMTGNYPKLVAVTLSLTRDEAVLLTHALHYGKIRLGLAASEDSQQSGIGDAQFATNLMKTKTKWGSVKEEGE
ncbi:RcpC/CpaB family pilus assembly protein [Brevibacillus sp. TJ4]|uniref:RcpC/CpaB family pilus assembly protein n=1 Tax=Brevibacillus sp. TJ4 TaxID=3234853 RepID=UPI0037CE3160